MPKEVHVRLISMLERLNTDGEPSQDTNSLSTLQQEGGEADNKEVSALPFYSSDRGDHFDLELGKKWTM